ncbi:MAG: hypothetical protein ACD_41C00220G0001 [uncultured bacterium]|nr:MAG: hypothetical protein ACD_41C00220G0001 [uncultured bacterium]
MIIASAVTLGNILDADGTVTINSGSLDVSGTNYGITVGGGWTDAGAGTFTEGSGTVTFDGSGTVNSNEAFEHVTINSAGTLTLGADLDVDGNLTLTAGILDTANTLNYGITVGGNWANTGTFTQRNGKVTFDTVGTTSTISGDTTFYDFTCITPNKPLTFTAGKTQTISGALTLTGTADNLIMLRSTVNGSYWGLTVNGTQSVSYVNVKDSDASGGTAVAQTNSTDAGHNLNWTFNVAPTAPTTLYSNTTADTAQSGLSNPGNLTDSTPNFSAVYTDSDVGDIGNKYCIEVNTASDFGGSNLWFSDSASCATGSSITNITAGNRSSDIEYAGSALSCGVTYYWRIKFWDDSGAAGSYSAAANFQVNCAPTVADDSGAVNEDAVYSGDLSHVDGDGDAVTYSIVSTTSNGVTNLTNTSTGIFTYTPTANFNGSDSFTYRVNDGTVNSNTATFTITVNSVNDVPSFTKGANQTVAEDAGAQTVTSWATGISAGPSNESAQTLTFNVSNDNNSLFSVQPSVSTSTGNLTYSPAANANGSATVTLNISDNGGTANGGVDASANQTFTITVTAVNDAPSFTKGANQTVAEDAGAQTASGWATSISAGPSDESAQTLTFNISNDNNALFSAQPSVSTTTGTLTYTPATNVNGSTTVTLSLSDSGGDTSASQTFTITVTAVNDVPTAQAGFDQTINEDVGSATLSGTASSDVEGSTLTYSWLEVTDSGDGCSLSSTTSSQPTVTLANRDSNYACSFELKVNDGTQDSAADSTVLNVTSNNDQPVLPTLTDQTVNEGETVTVAITATDPDTAVIGFAASDSDNGLDEFFTDNGNNTATFRWTPDFQSAGTYTVAIAATDNNTTVTSALTIDVVNVNRAPTFGGALPNLAVVAGSTTAALFDLDDYFTDLDGDTLTYTVSGNDDATVTLTDGVVTLTVPETTGDSLALTFTATDSNSASAVSNEIIVTITHASIDPEEIDHIGGADTGAGVIIIYDDKGEVLAEWQAFEIGGVIPRLVVINDEAYVFAVKKTSGSTIHAYSSTGEVLRKKRISPKLHWRRIAAGDVYKKNNQEEIVVATKRGSTVYVKVFTFRPNTGVFKIVERSVVFNVFGEFRVSVRNNKIHIKDIDDNQDITVDRWY